MTAEHEAVLRRNYDTLVMKINPGDLVNSLYSRRVITHGQLELVNSKTIRTSKNEELLQILLLRPDSAFALFIEALHNCSQSHIARILTTG